MWGFFLFAVQKCILSVYLSLTSMCLAVSSLSRASRPQEFFISGIDFKPASYAYKIQIWP